MNTSNQTQHPLPLADYVDLPQLMQSVKHTFPTADSVKWFVRRHRVELAASGALITLTGRLLYHPARFAETAVEIGRTQAFGSGDKTVLDRPAHTR